MQTCASYWLLCRQREGIYIHYRKEPEVNVKRRTGRERLWSNRVGGSEPGRAAQDVTCSWAGCYLLLNMVLDVAVTGVCSPEEMLQWLFETIGDESLGATWG